MPINTMLNLKTVCEKKKRFKKVCEKKKRIKQVKHGFYFGAMFFQVHFLRTFFDSRLINIYQSLDERFSTHVDPCP